MKLSIRSTSLLTLIISWGMASCLKDKNFDDGLIQSVHNTGDQFKMIEIKVSASSSNQFLTLSLDPSNKDTTLNLIPVNLSTPGPATEDIQVTLVQKNSLVTDYNNAQGTDYQVPPASMFTLVNTGGVVKITQGSNTAYLQLKFKPTDFLGGSWALGYQIGAVDKPGYTISSNLNTGIVSIVVKNQYEGNYHATGYFQHPTAPRAIDQDEYISTINANSISKPLGDLGVNINITINANNTVSIAPGSGTSGTTASVAAMSGDGTYNNTYDPATHTFWLKYGYPQPGPTRIVTEKVTLQ